MRPFLGIDLTSDRKNQRFNGEEFLVATPSFITTQALSRSMEESADTINKAKLPAVLRFGQFFCGFTGSIIAISLLKALRNTTIIGMYANAPWLFWLAGSCLLVWSILKFASMKKAKTVLESEESIRVISSIDDICSNINSELSIPSHAKEADLLSFFYKIKDGRIKVCEKALQITPYYNPVFRVFADSENLYIANLEGKYAFPLSSISAIHTVQKQIRLPGWNKEEQFDQGVYKQYKLKSDSKGCIHCKCYHILELNCNGDAWGIYFPNYELPAFQAIVGITCT